MYRAVIVTSWGRSGTGSPNISSQASIWQTPKCFQLAPGERERIHAGRRQRRRRRLKYHLLLEAVSLLLSVIWSSRCWVDPVEALSEIKTSYNHLNSLLFYSLRLEVSSDCRFTPAELPFTGSEPRSEGQKPAVALCPRLIGS